jgi:hypothetical protein
LSPFVYPSQAAQQELGYLTGLPGYSNASEGAPAGINPITGQLLGYGGLTTPFMPTQAQLAATPGYQFTKNQGLQAVQNSFAAQGLGSSGAAMKGAANYAEGLASTTYQQQFNNYWQQLQNYYNMISGQVAPGTSAGASIAGVGSNTAGLLSNQIIGGAQAGASGLIGGAQATAGGITGAAAAGAAGTVGAANAITGTLGNLGGAAGNAALLYGMYNSGMFGPANSATSMANNPLLQNGGPSP